jgi:hypothetical protein
MKKVTLYLSMVACSAFVFASCENELDSWNSATYEYAGRFVVAATCQEDPAKSKIIEQGNEIYLYNTAANVANEIWLEDVTRAFPLKGKFSLAGNAAGFRGERETENVSSIAAIYNADDLKYIQFIASNVEDFPVPTAANQQCSGKQQYIRATLEEGKILPNGATSIGGNTTDGISLKIILHTDSIHFISYELDAEEWEDPGIPEYAWKVNPDVKIAKPEWDEHWTLAGYRYTGYPEDM